MRIQHAVVIGGSVAGLLAARVLADHADQVTILDRDVLPDRPDRRPGVAQSAHAHGLLPGGAEVIERLLPGTGGDLRAAGAVPLDYAADFAWLTPFGWGARFDSPLHLLSCTRELLEWGVRRRVLAVPGIQARGDALVAGLVADARRIVGVRLHSGDSVRADLVIDASGRASRAPAWLRALGYNAPPETIVDADIGYASQVVDAPSDAIAGALAALVQVAPPEHPRGGIAVPIENGSWLLTLFGVGGDHPPRDQAGFEAFVRSLRHPILAAVADGHPVGPVIVFRGTANRFRHFERLEDRPTGFLVTGDAACAFNPLYAQGMSAAAFAAEALGACLRSQETPETLSRSFPGAFAAAVKVPWMLATAADVGVAGIRPPIRVRAMNRYVARVMSSGTVSTTARSALLDVMCMTRPPRSLFRPNVLAATIRRPAPAVLAAAVPDHPPGTDRVGRTPAVSSPGMAAGAVGLKPLAHGYPLVMGAPAGPSLMGDRRSPAELPRRPCRRLPGRSDR